LHAGSAGILPKKATQILMATGHNGQILGQNDTVFHFSDFAQTGLKTRSKGLKKKSFFFLGVPE
jgi:hypothetical protein